MDRLSDLVRYEKLMREMTHRPQADIETLRGQDPLTDWALGIRERTLNPLATLAREAQRFQGLSPEEMGIELVGGGVAGTLRKAMSKTAKKTEYELSHELAQKNAALPINQGGLGLPVNNTAMDRAEAMGFKVGKPMYHGTANDIDEFKLFHGGDVSRSPVGKLGVSLADNPNLANEFANLAAMKSGDQVQNVGANVLPLLHRIDRGASMQLPDDALNSEVFGAIVDAQKSGYDAIRMNNYTTPGGTKDQIAYLIQNPNQIRSRFAAFDPLKRNNANILAGTALGGVGLSALAGNQDQYY